MNGAGWKPGGPGCAGGERDPSARGRALPLAYLLTWGCYGQRVHGDDRGTVDDTETRFGAPRLRHDPDRRRRDRERMTGGVVELSSEVRRIVDAAIAEVCAFRHWSLYARNVRTTHVHVVLGCGEPPERPMAALKAWATRRLREAGLVPPDARLWTRHGSTRYLWRPEALEGAIVYVRDMQ